MRTNNEPPFCFVLAPGAKRNFSTMAKDSDPKRDRKRLKKDKNTVGGFTGKYCFPPS